MTEPVRYCIVEIPNIQHVLDNVPGFGDSWVTGWCAAGQCIFCEDKVLAVKILLLTGGRGFSREIKP